MEIDGIKKLIELSEKRDEASFGFIKQILLMSSGLLGILVSLHKSSSTNQNTRIAFALSVLLLSLGILLLSIALFREVSARKALYLQWKEELLSRMQDPNYVPETLIYGNSSKLYEYAEKAGYLSFSISIISLSIYAILIA